MRPISFRLSLAAGAAALALAAGTADSKEKSMFELTSPAFRNSTPIPRKYTCDGEDVSPPLAWKNLPPETAALALIMEDPDAPAGVWVHWVLYDAPAGRDALPEALPAEERLAGGAKQGRCWGVTEFERTGYSGPCPPKGKPHRYVFTAYALSGASGLAPGATKTELLRAMTGKVLAQAELLGLYGR